MDRDVRLPGAGGSLFRKRSARQATERLFGSITLALPPLGTTAAAIALASLSCVALAAIAIEVPLTVRATGVLMPPGGFIDAVAAESGIVGRILVSPGSTAAADQVLAEIQGDAADRGGRSVAELALESLLRERDLLRTTREAGRLALRQRAEILRQDRSAIDDLLAVARTGKERAQQAYDLEASRHERLRQLAREGHVPADRLDEALAGMRRLAADLADRDADRLRLLREARRLDGELESVRLQIEEQAAASRIADERLLREIGMVRFRRVAGVPAPATAIVGHLMVREGETVRRGQVIARLFRPYTTPEAWLYLPATSARLLAEGQRIELRVHAWPAEYFGTRPAEVIAVSRTALLQSDLSVPLGIGGPVFEVRAVLTANRVDAFGESWQLRPGTSFSVDVVQRRYRLYEWLFRALAGSGQGHA